MSSTTSRTTGSEIPIEEDIFEVDRVVDTRNTDGRQEFRIRWKGYGPEADTWEPETNLLGGCRDLVEEYFKNMNRSKSLVQANSAAPPEDEGEEEKCAQPGLFNISTDENEQEHKKYITSPVRSYFDELEAAGKTQDDQPDKPTEGETEMTKEAQAEKKKQNSAHKSGQKSKQPVKRNGRRGKNRTRIEIEDIASDVDEDKSDTSECPASPGNNEAENEAKSKAKPSAKLSPGYVYADPRKLLKDPFWHELQFGTGLNVLCELGMSRRTRSSGMSSASSATSEMSEETQTRRTRTRTRGSAAAPPLASPTPQTSGKEGRATRGKTTSKKIGGGGRGKPRQQRVVISPESGSSKLEEDSGEKLEEKKDEVNQESGEQLGASEKKDETNQKEVEKTVEKVKAEEMEKKKETKEQASAAEEKTREVSSSSKKPNAVQQISAGEKQRQSAASGTATREKNIEDSIASVLSRLEMGNQLQPEKPKVEEEKTKIVTEEVVVGKSSEPSQEIEQAEREVGVIPQAKVQRTNSQPAEQPEGAPAKVYHSEARKALSTETEQSVKLEARTLKATHSQEIPASKAVDVPAVSLASSSALAKRPIYDRDLPVKVTTDMDLADFFRNEMRASQNQGGKRVTQDEFRNACLQGDVNIVRLAVQYAARHKDFYRLDPEDPDLNGDTLLMQVASRACDPAHQSDDIMEYLVQAGADVNRQNGDGYCALHFAVERNSLCKVTKLLSFKASVNRGDHQRMTPLMLASKKGSAHIVYRLLEAGADFHAVAELPRTDIGSPGAAPVIVPHSALDLAVAGSQKRCVDMLSEHIGKVKLGFDQAMGMVLQDIKIKRQMCPLHCYALSEAESFRVVFPFENVPLPNDRYGYITVCALAKFQAQQVSVRLWGPCPVKSVELNSTGQHVLQQEGRFIFACWPLQTGNNTVTVHCNPDCRHSQMKLLIQVLLVQLKQPKPQEFS